jgi:hypothetical protein
MAALAQNQAQAGPLMNVLHDQNVPNTLGGIGPSGEAVEIRLPVAAFLVAAVVIGALLVILATRLA